MIFEPRPPQVPIIDFMLSRRRGNVFGSMGVGKGSATYSALTTKIMFGEARRILVLAPKRVARDTWPGEREKFQESFGHLKVASAIGTAAQRTAVVRSRPDILTINYDNLEWLIDGYGGDWPFDTVIADESTRLKGLRISLMTGNKGADFVRGQGSVRAKAISKLAITKVVNWFNLTGSPAPNGLQDLWGQAFMVDGGKRLGTSFTEFQQRWFRSFRTPDGYSCLEPLPHADAEIKARLRDICVTVDFADYYKIDKPFVQVIPVKLPPAARRIYETMEKELFAEIGFDANRAIIQAFNSGSKLQKCLQIGNGAVYDSDREWHKVHDAKLEALDSVVTEANGEPVIVRYTHIPDRERILKAFPKFKWLDDKPQTIRDWNERKLEGLVLHAGSAGHGLNLQDGGRILVDYSTDYNLEQDEQVIERIGPTRQMQSGHPRAVYRYRLIAEDTIEQHGALFAIENKASIQESFKNAMKVRRA